jgi:hypothetical protein
MTHLRKMMLDELQRRNYAKNTADAYIRAFVDSQIDWTLISCG